MFKKHKKILAGLVVGATVLFGGFMTVAPSTFAAPVNSSFDESQVKWSMGAEAGVIGIGISEPDKRGVAMAREAAIMSAQRSLVGTIQGVQIDSETSMRDLILQSDTVNRKITGVLKGAQIAEEKQLANGGYYVKMIVPLYGEASIADAIMSDLASSVLEEFDKVDESELNETTMKAVKNANYTGIVIDVSDLGLEPTFSPVIYDADGRAIYGIKNLKPEKVIAQGMVSYSSAIKDDVTLARAGNNPLVVRALDVRGGKNSTNKVNAVISVEDANKILFANEQTNVLGNCAVVFVK